MSKINPYDVLARFTEEQDYLEVGRDVQLVRPSEAVEAMEAYHRAKVEGVTDEEIEKEYPSEYTDDGTYLENMEAQKGAKWLRDKLLNQ